VTRPYTTFIGIDLGGSRGKSTALARLRWNGRTSDVTEDPVWVDDVAIRRGGDQPWCDEVLVEYLAGLAGPAVVAIDAPLTSPACLTCQVAACPGVDACEVPATVWLRTAGAELQSRSVEDRDRIAAVGGQSGSETRGLAPSPPRRLAPYTHRCAEVFLHYARDLVPRDALSKSIGPVSARAAHLRRVLASHGFELNRNLLEVSPRSTVQALFGGRLARGYKRDADPWNTRAQIIEALSSTMRFAPASRLSREEVLRNDHCFEALLSAYTAFLWARDDWQIPAEASPFADSGYIWAPPTA
jgi:predicted nuclease with RNAse H fold